MIDDLFKEMLTMKRVCNGCGKELDFWDEQQDFSIHKQIGYGSFYDGDYIDLQVCCDCMDRIIEKCAVSPIEVE